jgi:hypothetical protein
MAEPFPTSLSFNGQALRAEIQDRPGDLNPPRRPEGLDVMRTYVMRIEGDGVVRKVRCSIESEVWHSMRDPSPSEDALLALYRELIARRLGEILEHDDDTEYFDIVVSMSDYPLAQQFLRPNTNDRRVRFREFMRRLDPTADPALAVSSGYYVAPPNSVGARIATALELDPTTTHFLVGGTGSGKTTELIALQERLASVDDLATKRIDVPSRQRLDKLQPGVLLALAGTAVLERLSEQERSGSPIDKALKSARERIGDLANGFWAPDEYDHDDGGDYHWVPGVLEPPPSQRSVVELTESLPTVAAAMSKRLIMLFDGLDRVSNLDALASVLTHDVPALRAAGIGVVVIGPQHVRFSAHKSIEGAFESVYLHGAAATDSDEGREFLERVIAARVDQALLPGETAKELIGWSGGILRDLISLCRAAGAEAYARGADQLGGEHAVIAADRFGRDLLIGTTREMMARLRELLPRLPRRRPQYVTFTVTGDVEQRLLLERLIIEVPAVPVRYAVHPTILPLLGGVAGFA